jgi:hypothetical protein
MPTTLTPFKAIKQNLDRYELNKVKIEIGSDSSLDSSKQLLTKLIRQEAQEFKIYGHKVLDKGSMFLEDAFNALDQIMRIETSYQRYRPKKHDEKLGTSNQFEYFAKKAYLSTKRALPAICEMWPSVKKDQLLEIFAALDEFTTNKLLPYIQSKSLVNQTLKERELALTEQELR